MVVSSHTSCPSFTLHYDYTHFVSLFYYYFLLNSNDPSFCWEKVLYCHMSINQHKVLVPDNLVIVCLICGLWNDFSGMYFCFLLVLNSCLVTFEVGKLV